MSVIDKLQEGKCLQVMRTDTYTSKHGSGEERSGAQSSLDVQEENTSNEQENANDDSGLCRTYQYINSMSKGISLPLLRYTLL
jgi:hypothetical protein